MPIIEGLSRPVVDSREARERTERFGGAREAVRTVRANVTNSSAASLLRKVGGSLSTFVPGREGSAPAAEAPAPKAERVSFPVAAPGERNGGDAIREALEAQGLDGLIIGNPGSTEDTLFRALGDKPKLGLSEPAVVGMADGYGQATGRPAVAVLHGSVGLDSGSANLYHAKQRETPMLVIVGEAGVQYRPMHAHMSADLATIAKENSKAVFSLDDPATFEQTLSQAIEAAKSPPYGPVVLIAPRDVVNAPVPKQAAKPVEARAPVAPDAKAIAEAASALRGAKNPIILMGDDVARSGGQAELQRVAEALGARVYGAMESQINLPRSHPLYAGQTGHMFGENSAKLVKDADAVLVAGTYVFPEVYPLLESPFRKDAKVVAVNHTEAKNAKGGHDVAHAIVADPKVALGMLAGELERATPAEKEAAAARTAEAGAQKAQALEEARKADLAAMGGEQVTMAAFARALEREIQARIATGAQRPVVFNEALTSSPGLQRWVPADEPGSWYETPGGTLGVGIPGAIGMMMADPARKAIGFTGDGGFHYTEPAIGTAVQQRIPVGMVVVDNNGYGLLKDNLRTWDEQQGREGEAMPGQFTFGGTDYAMLARAYGADGIRVDRPEQIDDAVKALLDSDRPTLVHLVVPKKE